MVLFGVVGPALVVASEARRAADLASEPTHDAPGGAKGAAVFTVNARELAGRLLAKQLQGPAGLLAPLAVASLRDLTGALTIDRSALSGHIKLTIVK
jgi:ADP-ribosylglycohydrolase